MRREDLHGRRLRGGRCGLIPNGSRAIAFCRYDGSLRRAGEGALAAWLRLSQRLQGAAGLAGAEHGFEKSGGAPNKLQVRSGRKQKDGNSRSCYGGVSQNAAPFIGTQSVDGL
jgi:hypothetical protein